MQLKLNCLLLSLTLTASFFAASPTQAEPPADIHVRGDNVIAEGITLPFTANAIPFAAAASGAVAGNADVGKRLFIDRCSLCHSTDSRPGTGPGLGGIVGEPAASSKFGFTDELRNAELTWNLESLDRYLANPGKVVPGTSMAVATPVAAERRDIIAYLATLAKSSASADEETPQPAAPAAPGDWNNAAPGRRYRITTAGLAEPFATPSGRNSGPAAPKPNGVSLAVPEGFTVAPFAKLAGPRTLRVAPNGDIFVAETRSGRITVLRADDGADKPTRAAVFVEDLERPFGIAFYPTRGTPEWVYVATLNSVLRFPYRAGDLTARGTAEVVVGKLADTTAGHSTRDIVFSRDDKRMFVSVGSQSNIAETMGTKTADEIRSWDAARIPGAAWGNEANRANVLAFTPEGKNAAIFASGIRNCVSMTLQPRSDALWCVTNERDLLGDNLVPDYATTVKEGAFYGWPWYYLGNHEDPRLQGQRPDLAGQITVPDVLFQAHSAALGIDFYDATSGPAAFPAEYQGDAFVTFRGSWNRNVRTGYKVVRLIMQDGVATGAYEDFLTGFVIDNDNAWGRPTGIAVAHDGALLFSDDGSNTLWRIAYDR